MTLFHSTLATPFGPFSVATDEEGFVCCSAFGRLPALKARLPRRSRAAAEPGAVEWRPAGRRHARIRQEVREYCAGSRPHPDVPLRPVGSSFQQRVWQALATVPPGETRSYGQLARTLQTAPRAVGRANATNPVCLFVPCHRIVGGTGALTGFAFGNVLKAKLLRHEAVRRAKSTQVASTSADKVTS